MISTSEERDLTSVKLYLFILSSVGDTREDGHSHGQVEQQDAHLTVAVLQVKHGGVEMCLCTKPHLSRSNN